MLNSIEEKRRTDARTKNINCTWSTTLRSGLLLSFSLKRMGKVMGRVRLKKRVALESWGVVATKNEIVTTTKGLLRCKGGGRARENSKIDHFHRK